MATPHRPPFLSILRIELVVGQFVVAQKFIPHCPRLRLPRMYGSDVGLLFVRAKIAVREVKKFLEGRNSLEQVIFVCFGESNYNCYLRVMQQSNQR